MPKMQSIETADGHNAAARQTVEGHICEVPDQPHAIRPEV